MSVDKRVRPVWAQTLYERFGVNTHPNFGSSVYQFTGPWVAALADTGASYFRGLYAHELAATSVTTEQSRDHGVKWGMLVCPDLSMSESDLLTRLDHIATHAADVCLYIEGVNEPNYVRGGGDPPEDWPRLVVEKQRLIWEAVKSDQRLAHVPVVGPSLHAVEGTEVQYETLAEEGLVHYMDYASMHRYSGGLYPDHLLDERLAWVERYWAGKPTWITETGFTNALGSHGEHPPVPEDVSAVYAPSTLLEAADRGCNVIWYELLDDPDPGLDDVESNFGMYGTGTGVAPPWRPKPVVGVMRSFLDGLRDPGPVYEPPETRLQLTSPVGDLRATVVGKRNGSVTLYLRRATECWDRVARQRVSSERVPVVVQCEAGPETVLVDHSVTSVVLMDARPARPLLHR